MERGNRSTGRFAGVRWEWLILPLIVVLFLIVDVRADISVNDDWAYFKTVFWLYDQHRIEFTNWQQMTLISQLMLAWPWTEVFGFSQLSLRWLTISVSLVGITVMYRLILSMCHDRLTASITSLAFYFSPIVLASVASFMTDIYFWTFSVGAISILFVMPKGNGWKLEALGWGLACAALMVRQLAIAIPIGLIVIHLLRGDGWRTMIVRGVLPLLTAIVILLLYRQIVSMTVGLPSDFDNPGQQLKMVLVDLAHVHPGALKPLLRGMGLSSLYLGLFTIPIGISIFVGALQFRARMVAIALTVLAFALTVVFESPIPVAGNLLSPAGLGPRLLSGTIIPAVGIGWWLLTALACWSIASVYVSFGVFFLGNDGVRGIWGRIRREWLIVGLLVTAVVSYLPFILIYGPWIDRHMLFSTSLIMCIVASIASRLAPASIGRLAIVLMIPLAAASIAMLHDAFAWRRSIVAVIGVLESRGITPQDIDGGFEYSNLRALPDDPDGLQPQVITDLPRRQCVVVDHMVPGQHIVATNSIDRWLPLGSSSVVAYCGSKAAS